VHIFDFSSKFPNTGIENNISPETCIEYPEEGCKIVQLNYEVGKEMSEDEKEYAYFSTKKEGIVAKFWRVTFDKRVEVRKLQKQYKKESVEW